MTAPSAPLPLATAQACLAEYTCLDSRASGLAGVVLPDDLPEVAPLDANQLRQAVVVVAAASDRQILGICADSLGQGIEALRDYLQALNYAEDHADMDKLEPIQGPVFIKCNPSRGKCYRETYTGQYRGVLISYQSDLEEGVNETYGHLPLDLWA
jgi:hypothetical protein